MEGVQEAHNALDLCRVGAKGEVDVAGADGHCVAVNLRGGVVVSVMIMCVCVWSWWWWYKRSSVLGVV